jgi:hypothetical protein
MRLYGALRDHFTLWTSETLANLHRSTRRYNPGDSHLRTHRRKNLKSNCLCLSQESISKYEDRTFELMIRIPDIIILFRSFFLLLALVSWRIRFEAESSEMAQI